jgi:hypothetical protein
MEALLRTIFEAFPDKSKIIFKGKCSDCGNDVLIDIIPTSEGFGLLGGGFVECSAEKYAAKCHSCYKVNSKMLERYTANPNILPIFDKKGLLNSILSLKSRMVI